MDWRPRQKVLMPGQIAALIHVRQQHALESIAWIKHTDERTRDPVENLPSIRRPVRMDIKVFLFVFPNETDTIRSAPSKLRHKTSIRIDLKVEIIIGLAGPEEKLKAAVLMDR